MYRFERRGLICCALPKFGTAIARIPPGSRSCHAFVTHACRIDGVLEHLTHEDDSQAGWRHGEPFECRMNGSDAADCSANVLFLFRWIQRSDVEPGLQRFSRKEAISGAHVEQSLRRQADIHQSSDSADHALRIDRGVGIAGLGREHGLRRHQMRLRVARR